MTALLIYKTRRLLFNSYAGITLIHQHVHVPFQVLVSTKRKEKPAANRRGCKVGLTIKFISSVNTNHKNSTP
jgi:hypothetical protein